MPFDFGRREFMTALGGTLFLPIAALAQQATRPRSVAILMARSENDPENRFELEAFEDGLAKLGWTSGRNIDLRYYWSDGDEGRARALAAAIVAKAPDAIMSYGTQPSVIVKRLAGNIPIVFINVADPVETGLAAGFARPGGNVTGFSSVEFSLGGKWLSILKDIAPSVSRVMLLYNPDSSNWSGYLSVMEAAAPSLALRVTASSVSTPDEISAALDRFAREPNGGVIVVPSGIMAVSRNAIAALAVKHRLPVVYPYKYFAASGGLVSYGSDNVDLMRRAAAYVDRILKGEKPGELPIQAPSKFEFVINMKAAKAIGLEVPASIQILADEVIE